MSIKDLQKKLSGQKITTIDRVGKLLIFYLSDDSYLLIHLKMTGQLVYQDKKKLIAGGHKLSDSDLDLPNKHTHLIIKFGDKSVLYFSDLRKFGYVRLVDKKTKDFIVSKFGVNPLNKEFTLEKTAINELEKAFNTKDLKPLFTKNGVKLNPKEKNLQTMTFYRGEGCRRCGKNGYKGRMGIYEIMEINKDITEMINKRATATEIGNYAKSHGMITMMQDGLIKAKQGITTIEEVLRVTRD